MHKKGLQTKYESGKTGDFLGLMIWLHCVERWKEEEKVHRRRVKKNNMKKIQGITKIKWKED